MLKYSGSGHARVVRRVLIASHLVGWEENSKAEKPISGLPLAGLKRLFLHIIPNGRFNSGGRIDMIKVPAGLWRKYDARLAEARVEPSLQGEYRKW